MHIYAHVYERKRERERGKEGERETERQSAKIMSAHFKKNSYKYFNTHQTLTVGKLTALSTCTLGFPRYLSKFSIKIFMQIFLFLKCVYFFFWQTLEIVGFTHIQLMFPQFWGVSLSACANQVLTKTQRNRYKHINPFLFVYFLSFTWQILSWPLLLPKTSKISGPCFGYLFLCCSLENASTNKLGG